MPDLKISQLPVASATTGAELFPVVQGGVTRQIALNAVRHIGSAVFDASGNLGIGTASPSGSGNGGLTIGTTASGKSLHVFASSYGNNGAANFYGTDGVMKLQMGALGASTAYLYANTGCSLALFSNGTQNAIIDASGNLGLGVTPSAWSTAFSSYKALEIGATGNALWAAGVSSMTVTSNAFFDGAWKYANTAQASRYRQEDGAHTWFTAASGTAGNAISFTQAMTLDASGSLLVGMTGSASARLDVLSANTDVTIRARSANSNEVIRVESTGTAASLLRFINTANVGVYAGSSSGAFVVATTSVDRFQVKVNGQARFMPLSADPSGAETGDVYYNSSTNKLRVYNGAWVDLH